MEKPKSIEQREIQDAIEDLQESNDCNPHEHKTVTRGLILVLRLNEQQLWQTDQVLMKLNTIGDMRPCSSATIARNERDVEGGFSFRGFKAWGQTAREFIVPVGVCVGIAIICVAVILALNHGGG